MKKFIASIFLAVVAATAQAQIDTSNLTQAQIHELQTKAQEMSGSKAAQVSKEVRTELGAWGKMGTDLGEGLGRAIVSAAREVGMAANDFSQTSLGKIATGVIVYKLIGKDILCILVGFPLLIAGWYWGLRIIRMPEKVEYDYIDRVYFWGAFTLRKKYINKIVYPDDQSGNYVLGALMIAVFTIAGTVILF